MFIFLCYSGFLDGQDFDRVPEGGCQLPCGTRLERCGHVCRLLCHGYDKDHREYRCAWHETDFSAWCHLILVYCVEVVERENRIRLKRDERHETFKQLNSGTRFLQTFAALHLFPLSRKILKHIFLKNASLLVCETPFLHSLTVEWICGCRRSGVNMYYSCPVPCKNVHTFLCKALS